MTNLNELTETLRKLGESTAQAVTVARLELEKSSVNLPPEITQGVKKFTNFEEILTQEAAEQRIKEIQEWAHKLQG